MAACLSPITLKDSGQQVPCSRCLNCYKRRVSNWSFRLAQEHKIATSAYFITLTYNTQHVKLSKNTFLTLEKKDLQKFFKRLRKLNTEKITYYAVGEYGGKFRRPHYHIIIFNVALPTIAASWRVNNSAIGNVHYGTVTEASTGYTLSYITKGKWRPNHKRDDRQKPFSLMSKGLGANYLTPAMIKWHQCDLLQRMYVNLPDKQKASMPRYYKNKIYDALQIELLGKFNTQRSQDEELKKMEESENYFLDKQEKVIEAKRKVLKLQSQ